MCYGCWEEAGSPAIINDKVIDAAKKIKAVYDHHLAGGGLHITLDDWNCDDSSVVVCREFVTDPENWESAEQYDAEIQCLEAFEKLSEDERYSALALYKGFFSL